MFDTEKFIQEVRTRECLWNTSMKEYADRESKSRNWHEVGKTAFVDWDDKTQDEMFILETEMRRKWRNLRDSFLREYRISNGKIERNKKYVFYDCLQFLIPVAENMKSSKRDEDVCRLDDDTNLLMDERLCSVDTATRNNVDDGKSVERIRVKNMLQCSDQGQYTGAARRGDVAGGRLRKDETFEDRLMGLLSSKEAKRLRDDQDGDLSFFHSILPQVRRLGGPQRMHFRVAVMEALVRAQVADRRRTASSCSDCSPDGRSSH